MVLTNDRDNDRLDDERERERRRRDRDRQSRLSNDRSNNDRDRSPRGKKKSTRVFISNIPYEYRWQELKDLFRDNVGEVSFVELFVDENNKPRGCGIIEFATPSLAKDAVEKMHRYELKGRNLVVKEDNDVERDKYGRIVPRSQRSGGGGGGSGGGGGGGGGGDRSRDHDHSRNSNWNDIPSLVSGNSSSSSNKWGNTYGLSIQFLESLNIQPPLVAKCFVANLDYKVDDKKLREVFRLAGRVIHAEISLDKDGKSRGFGTVEYEHPVEAVQAISMLHNQRLYDRPISVRIDRVDKGDGLPPKLPEGLKAIGMGLGANGAPLVDVARNLPNQTTPAQQPASPAVTALPSVTNLAAAALMNNLIGGNAAATADLSSLAGAAAANPLAALTSATANPLAASLLGTAAGKANYTGGTGLGSAFGASLGRSSSDFDSLSAALSGGGGAGSGLNSALSDRGLSDRSRPGLTSGNSVGSSSHNPSDTIVIKNLPSGTTWQQLRDKCRDAGDVKFAEMRGKDTGIVQFGSQWDAQRAISMLDGIRVDGRIMDVRFY